MVKQAKKKRSNKFILGLFVLVVLFIGVTIVSSNIFSKTILSNLREDESEVEIYREENLKEATEGGVLVTPSPKPVTNSIPANYGRQVSVPILYYHYVGNNPNPEDKARDSLSISPDKFDEQMGVIASAGYSPISLDTLYAALKGQATLPAKPIILTFDDGYIDFYINAFPILKKYNMHTTAFIASGLVGAPAYMSWSQIKEIDATGLVVFQAHSVSQPNLNSLSHEQVRFQLAESKRVLEETLGKPVNFMAYPYGASNGVSWEKAKETGYLGAVGTWFGKLESEGNIYNMPRIRVSGFWDLEEFKKKF